MTWIDVVLPIVTLIAGGGWFVTYRAYKKKQFGEATQAEADGWKAMQDVYQQTIDDLNRYCNNIREDRNMLHEENIKLREENRLLHERYNDLEQQIIELRKELARQGRRLETLLPFTCGKAGCAKRTKVDVQEAELDSNEQ